MHLKTEDYITWDFRHRPSKPSVKSLGKRSILSRPDFTKNVGVTLRFILKRKTINVGFSASSKKAIFEMPGKTSILSKPDFAKNVGGYPRIHLKTEDYKTWDFQHRPRRPSLKSLGKRSILSNPDFTKKRAGYPTIHLKRKTIKRGISSIVQESHL